MNCWFSGAAAMSASMTAKARRRVCSASPGCPPASRRQPVQRCAMLVGAEAARRVGRWLLVRRLGAQRLRCAAQVGQLAPHQRPHRVRVALVFVVEPVRQSGIARGVARQQRRVGRAGRAPGYGIELLQHTTPLLAWVRQISALPRTRRAAPHWLHSNRSVEQSVCDRDGWAEDA
jgi:hypothetical protein